MTYLNTKKIAYLDGWRGVAILLALGEHFFAPSREWIGAFGMLLFFVLSGRFGLCSFSLYLWQQPLMMAAHQLRISSMAAFLVAILLGALSFDAFENPIRILINRAWSSRKSAFPAATTPAPPTA